MGGLCLEDAHWQRGMDEYRAAQEFARDGRFREALDRARRALEAGGFGRRWAARLNSLICWLSVSGLQEPSPAAVLHGEEAVRLAGLCNDEWIRCEALARLVVAYCHIGDISRAEDSCAELARALDENELIIPGGWGALWLLRALVHHAAGDLVQARRCLDLAEESSGVGSPEVADRVRRQRMVIEAMGASAKTMAPEVPTLRLDGDGDLAVRVRTMVMAALLAEGEDGPTARAHARTALHRAIEIGRTDLAQQVRRRLAHLLDE